MKKRIVISVIAFLLIATMANVAEATDQSGNSLIQPRTMQEETKSETENTNIVQQESTSQLIEMKEKELKSIEDYNEKYGSTAYGMTAYLLNKVRIYSIPFAFVGIAIAAIYQYVLGVRKLDVRDRGFGIMIGIVTVFVICQVLPLIFAIVVRGFRG